MDPETGSHVIPLNDLLPEHDGPLTTRGLQEGACLLPPELPFRTVERLLGWMTKEEAVMSYNQGWLELRTARVVTAQGYRYLSGRGEAFVSQLLLLLMLCQKGGCTSLTLLGDGARWIRALFADLTGWVGAELILDWYHLKHKGYELSSLICRGRKAKAELLGPLL